MGDPVKTFEVDFQLAIDDWDYSCYNFYIDECPICKTKRANTDKYCSVLECIEEEQGLFSCSECGSEFKILEFDYCREPKEALIELVPLDDAVRYCEKESLKIADKRIES